MFRESSHGQLGRKGGGQVVGGGGEQVGGVGEGGDGWVGQVSNLNFRTNIPSGNESRDICPGDFCPRRRLSKETLIQGDCCPRRLLSKEDFCPTITCILVQGRNIAKIKIIL